LRFAGALARRFQRRATAASRSADFQVCCVAGFQTRGACEVWAWGELPTARRLGSRRYSRFGNLRYRAIAISPSGTRTAVNHQRFEFVPNPSDIGHSCPPVPHPDLDTPSGGPDIRADKNVRAPGFRCRVFTSDLSFFRNRLFCRHADLRVSLREVRERQRNPGPVQPVAGDRVPTLRVQEVVQEAVRLRLLGVQLRQ
jgi:hypothetical protein